MKKYWMWLRHKLCRPRTCQHCAWWRVKGETHDPVEGYSGIGICDNPGNRVRMLSQEHIKRFVNDERDAVFIHNSIRYPHDFGCIFFKRED